MQISVDGLPQRHDRLRGSGSFERLSRQLVWLREQHHPFTLSMCVEQDNLADMPAVVDLAADCGASNVHFMWYFARGRGQAEHIAPAVQIHRQLRLAQACAEARGISIDNIDAMKTQVFAPAGTIHDGGGSGWESVAVGPDGNLYPSAALVGVDDLKTPMRESLAASWRNSPVLDRIRSTTSRHWQSPWCFILGGGDADHSYLHAHTFVGDDPYLPLYEQLALDLIVAAARQQPERSEPGLRLKMGDILESCGAHGRVALLHSNCLQALSHEDSRSVVKSFYREAVGDSKEDILNSVCYDPATINHIPAPFRLRGYGCGSPVLDAGIEAGETVLDLGCGSAGVAENLGYNNLDFRKGYLEQLPVEEDSVDLILSNCVLNLSANKRQLFAEIYRVLKPGGWLLPMWCVRRNPMPLSVMMKCCVANVLPVP